VGRRAGLDVAMKRKIRPCRESKSDLSARILVMTMTQLSRLLIQSVANAVNWLCQWSASQFHSQITL
jgi:hypothetical protein